MPKKQLHEVIRTSEYRNMFESEIRGQKPTYTANNGLIMIASNVRFWKLLRTSTVAVKVCISFVFLLLPSSDYF